LSERDNYIKTKKLNNKINKPQNLINFIQVITKLVKRNTLSMSVEIKAVFRKARVQLWL